MNKLSEKINPILPTLFYKRPIPIHNATPQWGLIWKLYKPGTNLLPGQRMNKQKYLQ